MLGNVCRCLVVMGVSDFNRQHAIHNFDFHFSFGYAIEALSLFHMRLRDKIPPTGYR